MPGTPPPAHPAGAGVLTGRRRRREPERRCGGQCGPERAEAACRARGRRLAVTQRFAGGRGEAGGGSPWPGATLLTDTPSRGSSRSSLRSPLPAPAPHRACCAALWPLRPCPSRPGEMRPGACWGRAGPSEGVCGPCTCPDQGEGRGSTP